MASRPASLGARANPSFCLNLSPIRRTSCVPAPAAPRRAGRRFLIRGRSTFMRRAAASIVCGLLIACLGCTQVGLSSREQPGQDFSTYIHSLYDQPAAPAAGETTLRQADFPVRLAVAQIGE